MQYNVKDICCVKFVYFKLAKVKILSYFGDILPNIKFADFFKLRDIIYNYERKITGIFKKTYSKY